MVKSRYSTFDNGIGKSFENGTFSMNDAETYILKKESKHSGNFIASSGKQELYEMILNDYL
jgi:xylose isomerase